MADWDWLAWAGAPSMAICASRTFQSSRHPQIIRFISWLLMRRSKLAEHRQRALAITVAARYLAGVRILLWQALRGQSIVAPDETTLAVIAIWLAATATTFIYFLAKRGAQGSTPAGSLKALRLEEKIGM